MNPFRKNILTHKHFNIKLRAMELLIKRHAKIESVIYLLRRKLVHSVRVIKRLLPTIILDF